MDITLAARSPAELTATPDPKATKDAKQAGQDFEALMVTQMLKAARQAGSGGWMGSESKTANPVIDMAEEQLARAMAANGAFGIAKMLAASAALESAPVSSPAEPLPAGTTPKEQPPSSSTPTGEL